jgi:hypothetical protein
MEQPTVQSTTSTPENDQSPETESNLLESVPINVDTVMTPTRGQTTATTLDGNTFTANKVQRHGCYQPTPMADTPYGHSTFITELLTWVH